MGVLSLILALDLIETRWDFASKLYRNSVREGDSWPFMCVCVGFTLSAIQALRNGSLYSEVNRCQSVLGAVKSVFGGLFVDFLERCHRETEVHHAIHLNAVKAECMKDVKKFVARFEQFCANDRGDIGGSRSGENFTDAEDIVLEEGDVHVGGCAGRHSKYVS